MADERTIKHDWWVVSTALAEKCLIVECQTTGITGCVRDPSPEEWKDAFYAAGHPYPFCGSKYRVEINGVKEQHQHAIGDREDDIIF